MTMTDRYAEELAAARARVHAFMCYWDRGSRITTSTGSRGVMPLLYEDIAALLKHYDRSVVALADVAAERLEEHTAARARPIPAEDQP